MFCQEFNNPKKFFESLPDAETVSKFFRCSLEMGHAPFAIAAVNNLLTRGYPELIKEELEEATKEGCPLARRLTEKRLPTPSMERTVFENIILSAKNAAAKRQ